MRNYNILYQNQFLVKCIFTLCCITPIHKAFYLSLNYIFFSLQQFLQRLQHTRPTRGLSRTEQLTEYKHTLLHGVPIAAMHTSPVPNKTFGEGNITLGSTMGSTGRRSRPSSAKSNASTIRSRPGSAKSIASSVVSRPCSAKSTSRSVDNRPAWNDRFAFS